MIITLISIINEYYMNDSEKELEVSKKKLSKDEEPKKEKCKKEKKVSWRKQKKMHRLYWRVYHQNPKPNIFLYILECILVIPLEILRRLLVLLRDLIVIGVVLGLVAGIFIKYRNVVQFGRTLDLGSRGRRFESCHSD